MSTRARAAVLAAATWLATRAPAVSAAPTPSDVDACAEGGAAAWKALEEGGGVVPEIDEDHTQAPPGWWRYPGPRRSAEILAAEAKAPDGLYEKVAPDDLKGGDVLVRATGAGACGKMAVVAGQLEGHWMLQDASAKDGAARTSDDVFFDNGSAGGSRLRPEVAAYRVRVKSDSTAGHVRALARDLEHLERTVAERPPLLARGGEDAVNVKVHDLVDEGWSLAIDPAPAAQVESRALAGRALALAAALDWPGAAESAAAVLDDVLARAPGRADVKLARADVYLLAGQPGRAVPLAQAAAAAPNPPPRARYVLGRALLAAGNKDEGLAALKRYLADNPRDVRAGKLVATGGREPRLAPAPPGLPSVRYEATGSAAAAVSPSYGFRLQWPIPWRVVAETNAPDGGLMLNLETDRVLDDEGAPARGTVSVLVNRPATAGRRAELLKKAARAMFPDQKLKPLPPIVPGSTREGFRTKGAAPQAGEVTALEHGGVVYTFVFSGPARAYPKLQEEVVALVKSLTFTPAAASAAP